MRIGIIGGTRFTGPFVARELLAGGHEVIVLHRGEHQADLPAEVRRLTGDRHDPAALLQLREARPDVVIDMIAFTRQEAESMIAALRGIARRVIVPSSEDVYRAYGRLHGTEPGPIDPTPLTEDGPLREKPSIHGPVREKLAVEQVVLSQSDLPGTILRLPAIYGPGDYRMYELTRPMLDDRPAILLEQGFARWRWTHGYVENVAHAIVLAATNDHAAGRIYNVGEPEAPTQIDRVRQLAGAAVWRGKVLAVASDEMRGRFESLNWAQDWTVDTSRIRAELGYREIVPFGVGLRRTIEWHQAHPNEKLAPSSEQNARDDEFLSRRRSSG